MSLGKKIPFSTTVILKGYETLFTDRLSLEDVPYTWEVYDIYYPIGRNDASQSLPVPEKVLER